jgi:hypothetical protein
VKRYSIIWSHFTLDSRRDKGDRMPLVSGSSQRAPVEVAMEAGHETANQRASGLRSRKRRRRKPTLSMGEVDFVELGFGISTVHHGHLHDIAAKMSPLSRNPFGDELSATWRNPSPCSPMGSPEPNAVVSSTSRPIPRPTLIESLKVETGKIVSLRAQTKENPTLEVHGSEESECDDNQGAHLLSLKSLPESCCATQAVWATQVGPTLPSLPFDSPDSRESHFYHLGANPKLRPQDVEALVALGHPSEASESVHVETDAPGPVAKQRCDQYSWGETGTSQATNPAHPLLLALEVGKTMLEQSGHADASRHCAFESALQSLREGNDCGALGKELILQLSEALALQGSGDGPAEELTGPGSHLSCYNGEDLRSEDQDVRVCAAACAKVVSSMILRAGVARGDSRKLDRSDIEQALLAKYKLNASGSASTYLS